MPDLVHLSSCLHALALLVGTKGKYTAALLPSISGHPRKFLSVLLHHSFELRHPAIYPVPDFDMQEYCFRLRCANAYKRINQDQPGISTSSSSFHNHGLQRLPESSNSIPS